MRRASHCHKTDGTDSHDYHRITKLDIGIFRSGKSGCHHIHTHQCLLQTQSRRNLRQRGIRIWDQKLLCKDTWLASAQLMTGKRGTGMLKITLLDTPVPPVRSNRRNCHDLTRSEFFYQFSYLQHLRHALMSQNQVRGFSGSTSKYGMHIGRTRCHCHWPQNSSVRSQPGLRHIHISYHSRFF